MEEGEETVKIVVRPFHQIEKVALQIFRRACIPHIVMAWSEIFDELLINTECKYINHPSYFEALTVGFSHEVVHRYLIKEFDRATSSKFDRICGHVGLGL